MASLNPGKACAQAAHAANQFVFTHGKKTSVKDWQLEAAGFGTTIVLMADEEKIVNVLDQITEQRESISRQLSNKSFDIYSDAVYDPTYPVKDGNTTHYINIITCAYVFGPVKEVSEFLNDIPLMY